MDSAKRALIAALALGAILPAQQGKLVEVASIKPSGDAVAGSNLDSVRGRLTATNMTVSELIGFAYGLRDYQIEQAPKWLGSLRFDIVVKKANGETHGLEGEKALETEKAMLRELLADRFQLTTHRETRQETVYRLLVSKGGPKLQAHDDAGPKSRRTCGHPVGRRVKASDIAAILSRQLGREVFDRTALAGEYDFQLDFTPDSGPCGDPSGQPSIYTAVQQQLGLRLESSKGPVEFLVIDGVQKPSEN